MGDAVMVLDGAGGVIECAVRVLARREVVLAVQERRQTPRPACGIVLYQGISKGKAMDWIVQKATELGAVRIVPVLAERSVPQWDGGAGAARRDRWESVAIEALKQCGSPWLPAIEPPQPTAAVLAHHRLPELTLIAAFGAEARPIRCWFDEFKRQQGRLPDAAGVWVGPEGDFTAAEVAAVRGAGAQPASLGNLVLRSETAAVCSLSLIGGELQVQAAIA
jgi:16S rRNA (uracil1498-N3)-methyltransferase